MHQDFRIRSDDASGGRALDRLGIADATYLYAAAVDTLGNAPQPQTGRDEALGEAIALLAECLAPDAQLRLFLAGPNGPSQPLGTGGPAAAATAIRAYFSACGYVATQHPVGNVRIAFTGANSAVSTSQIPCYHWLADERMLLAPVRYRDGLFAIDKFCLTRQGCLTLSWRRGGPPKANRLLSRPDLAVSGGLSLSGADHEATELDGGAASRQPPGSGATVGSGQPAAPVHAGHRPKRCSGGRF